MRSEGGMMAVTHFHYFGRIVIARLLIATGVSWFEERVDEYRLHIRPAEAARG